MPNIKDDSTVEAIAREFTNNGRNKAKALETIGYSKGYANTQGIIVVYSNIRVKEAIARIDAETKAKHTADRQERKQFWTDTMNTAPNMSDRLRASELLGKAECDFIEAHINLDTEQQALTAAQKAQAARIAKLLVNERNEPKLVKDAG